MQQQSAQDCSWDASNASEMFEISSKKIEMSTFPEEVSSWKVIYVVGMF